MHWYWPSSSFHFPVSFHDCHPDHPHPPLPPTHLHLRPRLQHPLVSRIKVTCFELNVGQKSINIPVQFHIIKERKEIYCRSKYKGVLGRLRFMRKPICVIGNCYKGHRKFCQFKIWRNQMFSPSWILSLQIWLLSWLLPSCFSLTDRLIDVELSNVFGFWPILSIFKCCLSTIF